MLQAAFWQAFALKSRYQQGLWRAANAETKVAEPANFESRGVL